MMIDVRQREKTDFERDVIKKSYRLDENDIQLNMFDNANYGYFVSSFYGEFILHNDVKVKTINHFIKCEDYIYCFIEEIIENKYDDLMWYRRDHTQKIHSKSVFKLQDSHYVMVDFISNIKEIDDELGVLKLIRIFGEYSEFLDRFECDKNSYINTCHALLFKKFDLEIPNFDEYDEEYSEVIEYSDEIRKKINDVRYDFMDKKANGLTEL